MDDELGRTYRRWQEAEDSGRDDDAEAAFGALFAATAKEDDVPARFTAATMARVADASAHDARKSRLARRAAAIVAVAGGVALAWFGAGLIGSIAATAIARLLNGVIGIVVGVATAGRSGTSVWSLFASLGRAAAAFAADPIVTVTILAIQGIAIAALVALQRLLGSDWESSR
jgi:hypothetical protein